MAKKKNFSLERLINGERVQKYDYLVTKQDPLSFVTESFQKIIINIEYSNVDGDYKVIQLHQHCHQKVNQHSFLTFHF